MHGRLGSNQRGQSGMTLTKNFIFLTTRLRCSPFIDRYKDVGTIFHTVGLATTDAALRPAAAAMILRAEPGGRADSDESTVTVTTQAGSTAAATF